MTDGFAPKVPTTPPYASEVPGRSPVFKVHISLGHARLAVRNRWPDRGGVVYHLEDNEWVEIERVDRPVACSKCGQGQSASKRWYFDYDHINHKDRYASPMLCHACHSGLAQGRLRAHARALGGHDAGGILIDPTLEDDG